MRARRSSSPTSTCRAPRRWPTGSRARAVPRWLSPSTCRIPASAKAMADRTLAEFGGIDYLVNNAAIFGGMKLDFLITVDPEYYKKFMSVNLDGALWCTRAVYKKMAKRGGGAIINQSSTAAWLYSNFYGLAKVGINGLTQQLATELGGQNIRINAIAPGPIDTEANRTHHPAGDGRRHRQGNSVVAHGPARGSCRHVPVPAVGPGVLDHRADLQCRRRTDLPVMSDESEARIHRAGQYGRADGQEDDRMAGRRNGFRHPYRGDDAVGGEGCQHWPTASPTSPPPTSSISPCSTTPRCARSSASWPPTPKPGTVIAIHSTISDSTAVELAAEHKPHGIHIVDAPVSGGAAAAAKGELATMVGAEREVYERIKPAFKHWAAMVIHAGEPGAGTRMKLARNMLTFTSYVAACEAMKLAEAAGLDLQALGRVVRHTDALTSGPGAIMVREDMKDLAPDNFLYQSFLHARGLGEKDLSLALALGEAVSVDLPLARLAYARAGGRPRCAAHRERVVMDELRRKGLDKMNEVYGWEMPNIEGDAYFDLTVDHLFGDIWNRPGLSMRDKRIMTLTAVTAVGKRDLAEIQINAALLNGELSEDELKEMAVFLTHYLGFPLGSALNGAVASVVAKRKKAAAKGVGEDKKANVDAATQDELG